MIYIISLGILCNKGIWYVGGSTSEKCSYKKDIFYVVYYLIVLKVVCICLLIFLPFQHYSFLYLFLFQILFFGYLFARNKNLPKDSVVFDLFFICYESFSIFLILFIYVIFTHWSQHVSIQFTLASQEQRSFCCNFHLSFAYRKKEVEEKSRKN